MAEMILPGTYIEVRAEKLIAAGPISINNVGVVGTARRGPLNTVITPGSIGEARAIFGDYDSFESPDTPNAPLSLIRALELLYANGAQRIFAVRVAAPGTAAEPGEATYDLGLEGGSTIAARALARGSGYNGAVIAVTDAGSDADGNALRNVTITLGRLSESWRDVPARGDLFVQTINGAHPSYPYASKSATGGPSALFELDGSTLPVDDGDPATPAPTIPLVAIGEAAVGDEGSDGAAAVAADYTLGLNALANENIHIVVLAGQSSTDMADALRTHVESASTDLMKRERIGVIGAANSATRASIITGGATAAQDEGRIIYVGPGVRVDDAAARRAVTLPASYAAAAVAGRIASLDPHVSPTNKTLNVGGVQTALNGTDLEQLVLNNVLALETRAGAVRIVKGITSSTNTAYSQITTRRIVDYARFGVRSACDPYIGKLNNDRVRQAMKGTINGFLADMVDREMLISYELEVSATREQQIRGIAHVAMVLRPTFSIDYIRVVMNLE